LLTIRCDPAPSGGRSRHRDCTDAAISRYLTMQVLFGMALRQKSRFVESLPG